MDTSALRSDHTLAGHLVESFVVAELRKQASWMDAPPELFHFSECERAEVDVVIERGDGGIIGVEVKLAARLDHRATRGLRRLRVLAGTRWAGGVVLAAVPSAYENPDGFSVVPISALWSLGEG